MNIKAQWIDKFEERLWQHHTCDWALSLHNSNRNKLQQVDMDNQGNGSLHPNHRCGVAIGVLQTCQSIVL